MVDNKKIWFPRVISDGMVLSNAAHNRLYGKSCPHDVLTLHFQGQQFDLIADEQGDFSVTLGTMAYGGPYELVFNGVSCGEHKIKDVYVGETFVACGQSNMELPMKRVKVAYPQEWSKKGNPRIRMFKVAEQLDFHHRAEDFLSGEWVALTPETIDDFSAVAYFFENALYQETQIPIGILQVSYGGTPIQAWMPKELLNKEDLKLLSLYEDDQFVHDQIKKNEVEEKAWLEQLDRQDYEVSKLSWDDKYTISIPCFFGEFLEQDFCGSVWFKREFKVCKSGSKQDWMLHLGTLVDADDAYINGVKVGHTDYQYPPRWYPVENALLKEGTNQILVRIIVAGGHGRWTRGKAFYIEGENQKIDLSGEWLYRVGTRMPRKPLRDFIVYKPTGFHNGMLAQCFRYGISGFLWYQGESNTGEPSDYALYLAPFITYIRESFGVRDLPVAIVQLPNFDIDLDSEISGWPQVREVQRQVAKDLQCGLVVTLDLGESNDLHPLKKKQVGERLASYMLEKVFNRGVINQGPELEEVLWLEVGDRCYCTFNNCHQGLTTQQVNSLSPVKRRYMIEQTLHFQEGGVDGFEMVTHDHEIYPVHSRIVKPHELGLSGASVVLITLPTGKTRHDVSKITYGYENNPVGRLLCNSEGFMASPFICSM